MPQQLFSVAWRHSTLGNQALFR